MRKDWELTLERLSKSISTVNSISDKLTKEVMELEDKLVRMGVGIETKLEIVGSEHLVELSYSRSSDGRFRIRIGDRAWAECSRLEKLESYQYIQALLEAILKEVDKLSTYQPLSEEVKGVK